MLPSPCLAEVGHFIDFLFVTEPTPRLVALTFILFHWVNMRSLSRLLSKIGITLQHLRLIPGSCSLSSDLLFSAKLTRYPANWDLHPYNIERELLALHVVSKGNKALRYLDLRFLFPSHYIQHLPAYIGSTPVEEVMIMVAFLNGSDQRAETEVFDWLTLDKIIVESLTAAPRENFSLCLYIPYLTTPTSVEDLERSVFPRRSALGVLSFVYYDDMERANQAMETRLVLTRMW